jgi:ubiquinone/menaquinone biosynthesis C-methylase UbiE
MDYDKSDIASVYDEARGFAPESLRQWLGALSAHLAGRAVSLIVDVGCGTGRFTEPLAEHFSARVFGIDPSQKMLDQARRKLRSGRVVFERASAEALPVADNSVDMVFMSMAFHHFANPDTVAKESWRVLHNDGRVFIRNSTREADFPTRHFFPTMRSLIESELPTRSDVTSVFETAGFTAVAHEIVRQTVASTWRQFVEKSSFRADSFLARLSDEDYEAGMVELRAHAAAADEPVVEEIDLFVFTKYNCIIG